MRRERTKKAVDIELKKPDWIRVKAPVSKEYNETKDLVKKHELFTVCQEAACPNIGECWQKKHSTIMILGDICTRSCKFCNVKTGKPKALDPLEPYNAANLCKTLNLNHMVITSVDRDDLEDGGAYQFVKCIEKIRVASPKTTIEILTPDFLNKHHVLEDLVKAKPDVYNHNLETVPRLYREIKPKARYFNSLNLLWKVKQIDPNMFTKSGIMVGLGEKEEEVIQIMDDLRSANVDFLTIGQYLQPTPYHAKVMDFVTPEQFKKYERLALSKGFLLVSATPLTRSSYHADSDFAKLRQKRLEQNSKQQEV